jgi:hypothetical protein
LPEALVSREEKVEGNKRFSALHIETENAVLALLSEGDDRLGTLAVSIPSTIEISSQPVFSSILLGDRNVTVARMLAERGASKTRKITLVSVFLKTVNETEAAPILVKLLEKIDTSRIKENSKEE